MWKAKRMEVGDLNKEYFLVCAVGEAGGVSVVGVWYKAYWSRALSAGRERMKKHTNEQQDRYQKSNAKEGGGEQGHKRQGAHELGEAKRHGFRLYTGDRVLGIRCVRDR